MSPSPVGDRQRPWARSQMVVWGQQCTLSAQHEACRHRTHLSQPWLHDVPPQMSPYHPPLPPRTWGMGQHPQVPFVVMQQVASSGHSDCPSGQGTARGAAESGNGVRDLHIPSSPHQAHPRAAPPIPRDVMQELPSALQRDPWGQQWRPPAQGTPWGERRGGGRAAGGEKPPPPPQMAERGGGKLRHTR